METTGATIMLNWIWRSGRSLVGAFVNEIVTKRRLLIVTTVASIVGLAVALMGQTILINSVGFCINFAAGAIQNEILQCYIADTVSEDGI